MNLTSPDHRSRPLHALLVAGTAAILLLPNLGGPSLWDEDEPKNAACTLAMLARNDWVVPTFNGRLRTEKPALVNWVQIAGCGIAGRNETGLRLGSAVLTIGSCLMTWRIGCVLAGNAVGFAAGMVMACSTWAAVGGRAATPDPPLLFCATAAFAVLAHAAARAAHVAPRSYEPIMLSRAEAIGFGIACGLGVLAKGPVGVLLPTTALLLLGLLRRERPTSWKEWPAALGSLRIGTVVLTAIAVATPWYAWVTWRTGGEWLRGFLFVHNVGRFTSTFEGHSGSLLYYPIVLLIGLFPWTIAAAAAIWHSVVVARSPDRPREAGAILVAAIWAATWIGFFSAAGTKLPGYIWPAYPAIAVILGIFWTDWRQGRLASIDRLMPAAWASLAIAGVGLAVGLPIASRQLSPGCEWCGLVGLVPVIGGIACWKLHSRGSRASSVAAVACSGAATLLLLAAVVTDVFGEGRTPRSIQPLLARHAGSGPVASFRRVPPSVVFYAAKARDAEPVAEFWKPEQVAAHFASDADARLITESRFLADVDGSLPVGVGVIERFHTLPDATEFVLLGRIDRPASAKRRGNSASDSPNRTAAKGNRRSITPPWRATPRWL